MNEINILDELTRKTDVIYEMRINKHELRNKLLIDWTKKACYIHFSKQCHWSKLNFNNKTTGLSMTNWSKLNSYFRQKTIHGVRNVIFACSLGMEICVFTFGMNFELRGWPPQPPTFSSNITKITKNAQF